MNEQEQGLARELAQEKAYHKATQEFFREALAAVLLRTQPTWHFNPEECERAREAHPGISREEDGGLTVRLEEEDEEEQEEGTFPVEYRSLTLRVSRSTLTALALLAMHSHESINVVIERLARTEGTRVAERIEQGFIESLQGD
jgi:hypothetical protein